ncbi:MAG: glycerate kinase, partial [Clostridia bacterium]|nr:glycerate kinase [Clostridia bacterium]
GENGAAAVFGPQKGADPDEVALIDRGMRRASSLIDPEKAFLPGAGAAGGMGYAVLAILGGTLGPGIEETMRAVGLEEAMEKADLAVTGEGSFDRQSLMGKAVGGVASLAKKHGVPLYVLAGLAEADPAVYEKGVTAAWALTRYPLSSLPGPEETKEALEKNAEALFRTVRAAREASPRR